MKQTKRGTKTEKSHLNALQEKGREGERNTKSRSFLDCTYHVEMGRDQNTLEERRNERGTEGEEGGIQISKKRKKGKESGVEGVRRRSAKIISDGCMTAGRYSRAEK